MKPNNEYVYRILIHIGNLRTEEELKDITKELISSLSTALKNELESKMVIISDSVSRPEVYYDLNSPYKGTDMEHEIIEVIPKENINIKCDLNKIINSSVCDILQKNGDDRDDRFGISIMALHTAHLYYYNTMAEWREANKPNGGKNHESKSK